MYPTYRAILRGHYLEWKGETPSFPQGDESVEVHVTLIESVAPDRQQRGVAMAAALEILAAQNAVAYIKDPVTWQRKQREERTLPGREDHDN